MSDSRSWDLVMEPIVQISQALKLIENVCKISSLAWVNKNQCQRLADRFSVIAEGLKSMGLDKNLVDRKALDSGSNKKDYPGFDELLTVLRKGEALVSSYDGVWKVFTSAISRTDNREAFFEIHQELDTLNSRFDFEGPNGKYVGLASAVVRSDMLMEDAEKDLEEMPKKLEELAQTSQQSFDFDLETLKQVVMEKSKPVGEDGKLPIYLSIDLGTVETKAPIRELGAPGERDPTHGWALVRDGSWLGCEFAMKVFKSGDQSDWNKEQLLKEVGALVELRHPHVIRLVGFGQDSERSVFLMEKMVADLRNFMKKKLEHAPRPKPRPFTRSEELDIITQIAKGMHYLHTRQYVHGELKCTNILAKQSGDYIEVKIAYLRDAMKLGGVWDQAAFDIACLTRRPRWTAPEAIKHFRGVRPSPDSLLKSDVYSFAMTCYEVVTGRYPFDDIRGDALLQQIVTGVRPELPGELDVDLKGVITSCWDPEPNNRPHFESICHVLDYIKSKQSAIGTTGKDVILNLFRRIPPVHETFSEQLGWETIPPYKSRSWDIQSNCSSVGQSTSWDEQSSSYDDESTSLDELDELDQFLQVGRITTNHCNPFPEHLRIKPSDLKEQHHIGTYSFGRIYTATWLGCRFTVKRFKSQASDLGELTRKLEFLISLRHPYIVQLVGLSLGAGHECMLVMELISSQNLRELIESRNQRRKLGDDRLPFDLHEAVLIIWKIALGMAFLHSKGVTHGDLKSFNVVVQEHPGYIDVKIVNFGLPQYQTYELSTDLGTGFWQAPEILPTQIGDRFSKPNLWAVDVYAFAMTAYEVVTGRIPYSGLERVNYDLVIGGYRPELPSDLYPDLKALIEQCWHGEPEQRPDFIYICEELQRIERTLLESNSNIVLGKSTPKELPLIHEENILFQDVDTSQNQDDLTNMERQVPVVIPDDELYELQLMNEEIMNIGYISEAVLKDLDGNETIVLCIYNVKDNLFEFYFKHYEDMANVVGVGLEYAKATLVNGWKVEVEEIFEAEWVQTWKTFESTTMLMKLLSLKCTGAYTRKTLLKPLLWDLAKYFTLQETMKVKSVPTGSEDNNDNNGGLVNLVQAFSKWFSFSRNSKNGEDNNDDEGNGNSGRAPTNVGPSGTNDMDVDDADTTVIVKLLSGGEIFDTSNTSLETSEKLKTLDRTIDPKLEFTFVNQGGIRKVKVTVGKILFKLRYNMEHSTSALVEWRHNHMEVSFGLRGDYQRFGQLENDSFEHLDVKQGKECTLVSLTTENKKGKDLGARLTVSGTPHGVGINGYVEGKLSKTHGNSEQVQKTLERSIVLTEGGLLPMGGALPASNETLDECLIMCTYSVPPYLENTIGRFDQSVSFRGTWVPLDDDQNCYLVQYTLIASRILEEVICENLEDVKRKKEKKIRGKSKEIINQSESLTYKQKYSKQLYVNHDMTHLDGEIHKLQERKRLNDNSSYFCGEGNRKFPYEWKNGILVKLKEELSIAERARSEVIGSSSQG